KCHTTESVFSSSIGTRHSKCRSGPKQFGHKQIRPVTQRGCDSGIPSTSRLYTNPYAKRSKSILTCFLPYGPSAPFKRTVQLRCIHSKWTGSIEFSWHCTQLHGTC